MPPTLAIVIPCYNEVEALRETERQVNALLDELLSLSAISQGAIAFVDDGSHDGTWPLIQSLARENPRVAGIKLSRNFGHQGALLAGLLTTPGDVLISIDADLQDDLAAIKDMLAAHASGAEIVYGVRRDRGTDTWFKRATGEGYYSLLR